MKHLYSLLFALGLAASTLKGYSQATLTTEYLNTLTKGTGVSIGLSVREASNGLEVFQHRAQELMAPASNLKLLSTYAALYHFGPDYRFETKILGKVNEVGQLSNCFIQASYDPTLGSERFNDANPAETWARALKAKGVNAISGDVSFLMPLEATYPPVSPFWAWSDLGNYYGAALYPINYKDNTLNLFFNTSGAVGEKAILASTAPSDGPWTFINEVTIGIEGSGDECYVYAIPGSRTYRLTGTLGKQSTSFKVRAALLEPEEVLARDFLAALSRNGIQHNGNWKVSRTKPTELALMHAHYSPRLEDIVTQCNFYSVNLYAEACYALVMTKFDKKKGLLNPSIWQSTMGGPSAADLAYGRIFDGSGMAMTNRISPALMTNLLSTVARDTVFERYRKTIPLCGSQGTVYAFGKGTALEGNARLKSGSFTGVWCYSGYILGADKKWYAVSLLVNNIPEGDKSWMARCREILIRVQTQGWK
jgi:D-alanyl-D-alanine carboxypeptidase/D-alanyl-D-alanine-endopeptidase (penicillin-binding protein 4)